MALKYINENGRKIEEYDITSATDITLYLIAGISADLGRYMDEKGIDEEKDLLNPLTIIYWDVVKMRNQLFKMKTMEEVMSTQNKIIYIRDLVKKLEEN